MIDYCNKRFFVIFLSLSLVLPIYGMEKSNRNIFSGIFKTIVNTIRSPFSYLGRMWCHSTKKDNCIQKDSQVFYDTNNTELTTAKIPDIKHQNNNSINEKNSPQIPNTTNEISKFTRDYAVRLSAIFPYCYYKHVGQTNFIEKLKRINENNSARFKNALKKARKNKFLNNNDCDEINNCLKQNIDVNFCDNLGRNQLHIMLEMFGQNSKKFDVEIFKNLVKRGVRLDADKGGVTPLGATMVIASLEEVNKRVDVYETVLSILIHSVDDDVNKQNIIGLAKERREAREYLNKAITINSLNNEIAGEISEAKKGIVRGIN